MLTAREIRSMGHAHDRIILSYDDRHRRRLRLVSDKGTEFLLDLPHATVMQDGEFLVLSDGQMIEVKAANEPLMEIEAADPGTLARLAWHIGNRHLAAQITGAKIRLRADHVIADMLEGLGATVAHIMAPFSPESGAYAGQKQAGHHHHDHGHEHAHEHKHGPDCDHSHDH